MKTTIQLHDFIHCDALKDNFSYEGRIALFEHLEEYETACGVELDFDPIAIRCEFTEYADIDAIAHEYTAMADECETEDDMYDWLLDRTQVIHFDTGIIIQDF